jgi:hypothetical protein
MNLADVEEHTDAALPVSLAETGVCLTARRKQAGMGIRREDCCAYHIFPSVLFFSRFDG